MIKKSYLILTDDDTSDVELVLSKLGWTQTKITPVRVHSDLIRFQISRSFNDWIRMKSADRNRLESIITAILSSDLVITRSKDRSLLGLISDHRIRVHDPNLDDLREFLNLIRSPRI